MSETRADIVHQFCTTLTAEGWEPAEWAIERIVDTSLNNKKGLREMLSLHSLWDCTTMRITMPVNTNGERLDVSEKMNGFRLLCDKIDTSSLDVFEPVLTRGGSLTSEDCHALQAKGYYGGKKGQKIGRAINAWSTAHGIDKHKDYNWRFNELINGGRNTTNRIAILSINPVDFLAASHGDFTSCHSIDRIKNSCYKSGNLSYAMDGVTMVFFTVAIGESADYPTKRIDRINYHFDSGLLIQGRLYTATRENIHAISRAMVCKVIADCLDVPNLWTKHAMIDQSRIESTGNHYVDYVQHPTACAMSTLSGVVAPDKIEIGHVAYCISCGGKQDATRVLDCCDTEDNTLECNDCGASVHEDDAIWIGDYGYCSECANCCGHCNRDYLNDDVRWIEVGSRGMYICDDCFNDNFVKCHACDKVVKNDEAHDADDNSYCVDCYRERFANCEECDELLEKDKLTETPDGHWLCRDCHCADIIVCSGLRRLSRQVHVSLVRKRSRRNKRHVPLHLPGSAWYASKTREASIVLPYKQNTSQHRESQWKSIASKDWSTIADRHKRT